MERYWILDAEGNEVAVDCQTWALWFQDGGARRIGRTDLPGGGYVSTVFVGMDQSFDGRRLLYETMIFGGPLDSFQERYATRQEAESGHEKAVSSAINHKPL